VKRKVNTHHELNLIYKKLFAFFGPQGWWPGRTRLEIILGAILTQNTNWVNVERALMNLKKAGFMNLSKLNKISPSQLAVLIKPSGYYNIKAQRLKNFIDFIFSEYGGRLDRMAKQPLEVLRHKILAVNGIGLETADSILLYAFDKPVFVVDAYTKRILSRHHMIPKDADYHSVQEIFMNNLNADVQFFNEYHALLVRCAKEYCRVKPLCQQCPLMGRAR